MSARQLVETWRFAAMTPRRGGGRDPVDDVSTTIQLAEQRAFKMLSDETAYPDADPELPPAVVCDELGRRITGVRLEREPGANLFTIVLETEQEAS